MLIRKHGPIKADMMGKLPWSPNILFQDRGLCNTCNECTHFIAHSSGQREWALINLHVKTNWSQLNNNTAPAREGKLLGFF